MKRLAQQIAPPLGYDRRAVRMGIVHLGLGAFHRAHQAPVFDSLLSRGDLRWGIAGISIRSTDTVAALAAQDNLYSLAVRDEAPLAPRLVGSIVETAVAAADPVRIIALLAAPDTHCATLTVTEKGYLLPEGDLTGTPPGLLALALEARRRAGLAPLTVISCDNLTANGLATRAAVLAAGTRLNLPDVALAWIAREVAFPSTMVDRITPATTDVTIAQSSAALGLEDRAAVWTEPFWQWVIEDKFAEVRPELEGCGVEVVSDVVLWEEAKLRLLNGAHSTLAYHGLLVGYRFVHEAIADPNLRALVEAVWDEATSTLERSTIDVGAYRQALLKRFSNAALPHRLIQIAADGSQKLPPRLIGTLIARRPAASPSIARAVAGWIAALASEIPLADPLIGRLRALARRGDIAGILSALGAEATIAPDIAAAWLNHFSNRGL